MKYEDAGLRAKGYTKEQWEASQARFGWNDGDVEWLDKDGNVLTAEQVKKMQAQARAAEAAAKETEDNKPEGHL